MYDIVLKIFLAITVTIAVMLLVFAFRVGWNTHQKGPWYIHYHKADDKGWQQSIHHPESKAHCEHIRKQHPEEWAVCSQEDISH